MSTYFYLDELLVQPICIPLGVPMGIPVGVPIVQGGREGEVIVYVSPGGYTPIISFLSDLSTLFYFYFIFYHF